MPNGFTLPQRATEMGALARLRLDWDHVLLFLVFLLPLAPPVGGSGGVLEGGKCFVFYYLWYGDVGSDGAWQVRWVVLFHPCLRVCMSFASGIWRADSRHRTPLHTEAPSRCSVKLCCAALGP